MTQLNSTFTSGNIFTAGSNYGVVGVSGLNEITNRINTHTHEGSDTATLMSYGSGAQSPIGYELIDVDDFTNVTGCSVTIATKGRPVFAMATGYAGGGTAKVSLRIQRSGASMGTGYSYETAFHPDTSDPTQITSMAVSWIDTVAVGSSIYSLQAKQPNLSPTQDIGSFFITVFELT